MPVLEFQSNKALALRGEPTIQGENNAETLTLLLPERYHQHELRGFTVSVCLYAGGRGNAAMMDYRGEQEGKLVYTLPLTVSFTQAAKRFTLWVVLTDPESDTVIKSGRVTFRVEGREAVSDTLEEGELELLAQWQNRMSAVYDEALQAKDSAAADAEAAASEAAVSRQMAEEAAVSASYAVSAESERVQQEILRQTNEEARQEAEQTRRQEEALRLLSERERKINEESRELVEVYRNERLYELEQEVASWRAYMDSWYPLRGKSGHLLALGDGGKIVDSGLSMKLLKPQITSWEAIQGVVRSGLAPEVYAIGERFTCNRCGYTLCWEIIGFDHDIPADGAYSHSMSLQLVDCFSSYMQYDAPESLYYCAAALEPTTQYFTLFPADVYEGEGGGRTFHFTPTKRVSPTGTVVLSWPAGSQASACTISTYYDRGLTRLCESGLVLTEGKAGWDLDVTNHSKRIRYGSSHWERSALRQWLNSDAYMGSVWKACGDFDLPPEWVDTRNGFLYGMDADFLAVLGRVKKTTRLAVCDGSYAEESEELFFLPSLSEVGGAAPDEREGEAYERYRGLSTNDACPIRTKVLNGGYGNGINYFLRTAAEGDASDLCAVDPQGGIGRMAASARIGVAPICNVI